MKAAIHPQYNEKAQVICVCGNRFTVGSTSDTIHIELCNKCHPFYTGEQKFVDSASRIQKFETRKKIAETHKATVTKKVEEKRKSDEAPKSLREMLMGAK
jgi:large subunit ribosomal protein L31